MKRLLISLFLLPAIAAQAQTARRFYYQDSNNLVIADSAGLTPVPYAKSEVSISAVGNAIRVQVRGNTAVLFPPAKFLDKNGAPAATVAAALATLTASIATTSGMVSKKSWKSVATYAELLTVSPIPQTLLEIFVVADEKRGGGPTGYNVLPDGSRYLIYFITTKDN